MLLDRISYIQYRGQPAEWEVDGFTLGQINLIVGRNAVGKSRTLNIIAALARRFLAGKADSIHTGEFTIVLHRGSDQWDYSFKFDNYEVLEEELKYNGEDVLKRGKGGVGQIRSIVESDDEGAGSKSGQVRMKFKSPLKSLSVVAKRDSIQHPYLEGLHDWADALRHFQFGVAMNGGNLVIRVKRDDKMIIEEPSAKDTENLAPVLEMAIKEHGDVFKKSVIDDMTLLHYPISDIVLRRPENVVFHGYMPGELTGVSVQEIGLQSMTDQTDMSAGMFRALSLISQVNYYMLSNRSGCILIDDIGEGLDFERSCILIDIIRHKAKQSSFQLIMSTNNRFVMNRVPLEEWCVLERIGSKVRVRNYDNSARAFERFKRTGLNNFDLLATNYLDGK